MHTGLFDSFFLGGFECSTHRRRDGRRLDVIGATRHDALAAADYRLLQRHGIRTARDGFRWHLIESSPGHYDFSSVLPMLRAARETGTQVIWDLWHYGWPDHLDIFSAAFPGAFAAFARDAVQHIGDHTDAPLVSPMNEISFFAWAGGEVGFLNPFAQHRGDEMKRQLVRASLQAIAAIRDVHPAARICQVDPIINIVPPSPGDEDVRNAEAYRMSQFQAWNMLLGRDQPELGGHDGAIDVIGVNYYIDNQFVWGRGPLAPSDPRYRRIADMLVETYQHYRRPIFVAETGIEDERRPAWLRYMAGEVFAAMSAGVPLEGLCLYPIVNHPGWDDDRHCHNGLFDYADAAGRREVYEPLAAELSRLTAEASARLAGVERATEFESLETDALVGAAQVLKERPEESRS